MLDKFLIQNQEEILALTEQKTRELAGDHPSSEKLRQGLPIFYGQMIQIIRLGTKPSEPPQKDIDAIAMAADRGDEPAMAKAAGQPQEAVLAKAAGDHGTELVRLGYTLSHVVHAYGAMCQAITEVASAKKFQVTATDFHALNRCIDVAIAGAVTVYQSLRDEQDSGQQGQPSHKEIREMRDTITSLGVAYQAIKSGTVGFGGSTGFVLEKGLRRIAEILDRSLKLDNATVK